MASPVFKTGVTRLSRAGWVRFPHSPASAALLALFVTVVATGSLSAQTPDTLPATSVISTTIPDPGRPISPGKAFLQSLLIPGRGQITLGKKNASRFYIAVEALSIGMIIKSYGDLREAKRHEGDSLAVEWDVDPVTGDSTPTRFEPTRFTPELTNARRTHVEDWIALLIFNHLLSAADAYVAANLWDFPAKVTVRARPPGAYARTSDGSVPPPLNLEARITGSISW